MAEYTKQVLLYNTEIQECEKQVRIKKIKQNVGSKVAQLTVHYYLCYLGEIKQNQLKKSETDAKSK